jgi:hypothetical protein
MRPLRAFLYSKTESGTWGCQTFRDFEPLLKAAMAVLECAESAAAIHVGFDRPATDDVSGLASIHTGYVLLSLGAVGTMPEPVAASTRSVGTAGEVDFYLALDGFGYRIDDPTEQQAALPPFTVRSNLHSIEQAVGAQQADGWVCRLQTISPDMATKLCEAGIWDEDTYIQREACLDADTRLKVAILRFTILEGEEPTAATIIHRLRSAPPWLLAAPVNMLKMSVRSSNVCLAHQIFQIREA